MSSHPDLPLFLPADLAIDALRWGPDGLLPVICQSHPTGEVLMFAHANRVALQMTRSSGLATYWSRSRQALWTKGETSGNLQRMVEIRPDCDGDCLLYLVTADGPACHTGRRSCFSWRVCDDGSIVCDRSILNQRSTP
jgi:phosphoribosyl-AMP cyclohydrolase